MGDYYRAWQTRDPLVLSPVLRQQLDCCGVIALARGLEARLKLEGRKPGSILNKSLSVQDLLIKLWMLDLIDDQGSLDDLGDAEAVLTGEGLVLEDYCALTYDLYEWNSNWVRKIPSFIT